MAHMPECMRCRAIITNNSCGDLKQKTEIWTQYIKDKSNEKERWL